MFCVLVYESMIKMKAPHSYPGLLIYTDITHLYKIFFWKKAICIRIVDLIRIIV